MHINDPVGRRRNPPRSIRSPSDQQLLSRRNGKSMVCRTCAGRRRSTTDSRRPERGHETARAISSSPNAHGKWADAHSLPAQLRIRGGAARPARGLSHPRRVNAHCRRRPGAESLRATAVSPRTCNISVLITVMLPLCWFATSSQRPPSARARAKGRRAMRVAWSTLSPGVAGFTILRGQGG